MNHVPRSARLPTDPKVLMNWVNALIESDFHSLKDLRSGIVWCRLLEALYPGSIDLTALKTDKLGWHRNYRVLRRTLRNLGLKPPIKESELVSGKEGDTIHLLHYFIDLFTMILARKIKQVKTKTRDAKASSTIEAVLQWFKSFFVKEREEPKKKSADQLKVEFYRQALLLLFVPIPKGYKPDFTDERVRQDYQIPQYSEILEAYRQQKKVDHLILRSLVESFLQLRRGRRLMERLWLESLNEPSAN
ncbi:uncharacterized protein LOC119557424 [Drosophila subpulchrella]|uniref:uncharacterized protein LOC119557424 n=1 Tax=Drosophila subpulchrella TaxID=1486046 RepID=UPI0018A19FD0|nr:uncharacterized protein LOC119557424 [Drosophila subpulchrella]